MLTRYTKGGYLVVSCANVREITQYASTLFFGTFSTLCQAQCSTACIKLNEYKVILDKPSGLCFSEYIENAVHPVKLPN